MGAGCHYLLTTAALADYSHLGGMFGRHYIQVLNISIYKLHSTTSTIQLTHQWVGGGSFKLKLAKKVPSLPPFYGHAPKAICIQWKGAMEHCGVALTILQLNGG